MLVDDDLIGTLKERWIAAEVAKQPRFDFQHGGQRARQDTRRPAPAG